MSTLFDCADPEQRSRGIAAAAAAVKNGGLVVLPTDTVYGVGADAFDSAAVAALLSAKGRGRDMPVPVLVGSWHTIDGLALSVSEGDARPDPRLLARRVESRGPPGALGAMGPRRRPRHGDAADAVASGRHRAAARGRADGGVERQRLRPAGRRSTPETPASSWATWWTSISMPVRRPEQAASTILDLTGPEPRILRSGPVSAEGIAAVLGVDAGTLIG